jgi:hypothetical protein
MTTLQEALRDAPDWLPNRLAIVSVVGSRMRGTEKPDSDWDRFGVCVEPLSVALGVHGFQQFARQDGDSDISVYGLRRACQLAEKGNPSLIENLFCRENELPERAWYARAVGEEIRAKLIELCRSRKTLANFGGYLRAQANRLEQGTNPEGKRAALVEEHGYDTKFAAHAVRLGLQGLEFAGTGEIQLPLSEENKGIVNDVLAGEYELSDVIDSIELIDHRLSLAIEACDWPAVEFGDKLNHWLVEMYQSW